MLLGHACGQVTRGPRGRPPEVREVVSEQEGRVFWRPSGQPACSAGHILGSEALGLALPAGLPELRRGHGAGKKGQASHTPPLGPVLLPHGDIQEPIPPWQQPASQILTQAWPWRGHSRLFPTACSNCPGPWDTGAALCFRKGPGRPCPPWEALPSLGLVTSTSKHTRQRKNPCRSQSPTQTPDSAGPGPSQESAL